MSDDPRLDAVLLAWRERGELLIQHCANCGATAYYPRPRCPACASADVALIAASGLGEVVGLSRVHRGLDPALAAEAPVLLAEIRLDEGATLIARVVAERDEPVGPGMRVATLPKDRAADFPLPSFAPA